LGVSEQWIDTKQKINSFCIFLFVLIFQFVQSLIKLSLAVVIKVSKTTQNSKIMKSFSVTIGSNGKRIACD
jgi:hypothetical protein